MSRSVLWSQYFNDKIKKIPPKCFFYTYSILQFYCFCFTPTMGPFSFLHWLKCRRTGFTSIWRRGPFTTPTRPGGCDSAMWNYCCGRGLITTRSRESQEKVLGGITPAGPDQARCVSSTSSGNISIYGATACALSVWEVDAVLLWFTCTMTLMIQGAQEAGRTGLHVFIRVYTLGFLRKRK